MKFLEPEYFHMRFAHYKGYGAQSAEEKQRLFKLMRNLNFNGDSGSDPFTPTAQNSGGAAASDGFYSPEFRGDFGAGLLDLHAMDDTELLSEVWLDTPHLTWVDDTVLFDPLKFLCIIPFFMTFDFIQRKEKLYLQIILS